jgi:RHS repeat-associated protein
MARESAGLAWAFAAALLTVPVVAITAFAQVTVRDKVPGDVAVATRGPPGPPAARALGPVGAYSALQTSLYTFDVTGSGEAVWNMPIWAPAGRNGMAPALSFSYRSRRAPGLLGQGFDISGLSSITRCWRTPAQDGRFAAGPTPGLPDVFCLDGQRLVASDKTPGELQPEFDPGTLVRINGPVEAPTSFDVYRSQGEIWRYGSREACAMSSQSQVKGWPVVASTNTDGNGLFTTDDFTEAASPVERVVAWNVDRVEDRWGNYYDVDYLRGLNAPWSVEVAPAAITWTGFGATSCSANANLKPSRRMLFVYNQNRDGSFMSRQNPRSTYRAGLEVRQTFLLSKVVIEGPDALVSTPSASRNVRPFREYRVAYRPAQDGKQALDKVDSITECVYNTATAVQCREPVAFSWTPDNPAVPEFLPAKDPVQAKTDDPSLDQDLRFDSVTGVEDATARELDSVVADFDGDGRDDYLYRLLWFVRPTQLLGVPDTYVTQWYLRLGTPTGLGPRHEVYGLPATGDGDPRFSPRAVDIDQDGRAEVLIYSEDALVDFVFRGDPNLNQYHVTDTVGYQVFRLVAQGCQTPPFFECNFGSLNLGEGQVLHPLALAPRNSIAVQIGDLDGDGRLDLTRDDTDCPFSISCAVGVVTPPRPISVGFRKGLPADPTQPGADPAYAAPLSVRRAFPAVGPFTNVVFRQFDGRYMVDLDGNGQPEILTTTYNFVPIEAPVAGLVDQYPFALSALSFGPSGDGQVAMTPIALSARPLAISPMMQRFRGPCLVAPDLHFGLIFLDVNGDGLDDAISFSESGKDPCDATVATSFLSLNAGGSFRVATQLPFTTIGAGPKLNELFSPARGYDSGARVADLDGDGRSDIVYFSQSGVFWLKSTGAGLQSFQLPIAGTGGAQMVPGTPTQYYNSAGLPSGFGPRLSRLGDFNGDGILDLVTVRERKVIGGPAFSYFEVNLGAPRNPDMIDGIYGGHLRPTISIHFGFGGVAMPGDLYQLTGSHAWPQATPGKLGWVVSDYSVQAGDLESARPLLNVYRYQYETARRDLTGRGFLGVDRRIRQFTNDDATPTVFETEILDFDHGPLSRVCRSGTMCAYPSVDTPVNRMVVTMLDPIKYRVEARHTSRTVQARTGFDGGYDLRSDSVIADVCELDAAPQSTAAPCLASNTLISSVRQTRDFDAFGNIVRSARETSNGGSLMGPVAPPTYYEELRAAPAALSAADQARWLTSRYPTWDYTSIDPTLAPAERMIGQRVIKSYEPNSVEVTSVLIAAPPSAGPETDTSSGFVYSVLFGRTNWGVVNLVEESASGTARTSRLGFASGDPDLIFSSTYTNPLGQMMTAWPHATLGVPFAIDDVNGLRTRWDYDALGRPQAVRRPGGETEAFTYSNDLHADGSMARTWTLAHTGPAIADETTTFDSFGLRVGSSREEFGHVAARSYVFDRFGRLAKSGYPVDASQSLLSTLFVEYLRDNLGRVLKVGRPVASGIYTSLYQYTGRTTNHLSERQVASSIYRDAKGRVIRHEILDQGRPVGTDVDYWHFDLPRRIHHPVLPTDQVMTPPAAQQPETVISYDVQGRRSAIDDPDVGHQNYFYNGYGEVKRVEDANGGVTTIARDDLGRVTRVQTAASAAYPPRQPGGPWAQDSQFFYDTAQFGIGKPARIVSVDGITKTFAYDPSSRLQALGTIDESGQAWSISYEYNANGLPSAINYPPSGTLPFRVEYEYAGNGEVASIFDASSAPRSPIWSQVSKNLAGQSTREQFGTTETADFVYDRVFALQSQSGRFVGGKIPFQEITYDWGPDNLLAHKSDLALGLKETYEHDALRRLHTWDVAQGGTHTKWQYDYDDWGNLRQRHVVDGVTFDPTTYDYTTMADATRPHAVKRVTTGSSAPLDYGYLAGGQLAQGGGNTYAWTPLGLPASITNGAVNSSLLYDGRGRRVTRRDGATPAARQVTIDALFEFRATAPGASSDYVYNVRSGDRMVAQVRRSSLPAAQSLRFFHGDDLDNPDTATTTALNAMGKSVGQIAERSKFEPFGERRVQSSLAQPQAQAFASPSDPGFTGQQPDQPFALVNMGGRLYQPGIARFISPDPVAGFSSQALNRYSYARNSPVMHVDPTGFDLTPPPPAAFDFSGAADWQTTLPDTTDTTAGPVGVLVWTPPPATSDENSSEASPQPSGGFEPTLPASAAAQPSGVSAGPTPVVPAGGVPDAGAVEPANIWRVDEFGIRYFFADTKEDWADYYRAVNAVRRGMKEIPEFESMIWQKIKNRDRVNIFLRTVLPDANGKIFSNNASAYWLPEGAHSYDIMMRPSEAIESTYVVSPRGRQTVIPMKFEPVLFHEFGHMYGYQHTLLPDAGIGWGHEVDSDSIFMMREAVRIYDIRLTPAQQDALDHDLHPPYRE